VEYDYDALFFSVFEIQEESEETEVDGQLSMSCQLAQSTSVTSKSAFGFVQVPDKSDFFLVSREGAMLIRGTELPG
jgi:hypothetical protein